MNFLGKALKGITTYERNIALYFIWYILPRFTLMLLLCFDTFYFHQLHYIYKYIFLTLIIPISYYLIYCIRLVLKQYMEYLDYYHQVQITSGDFTGEFFEDDEYLLYETISIEHFISRQTVAISTGHTLFTYSCVFKEIYNTDAEQIIIPLSEQKIMEKEFFRLIVLVVRLQLFIEYYDLRLKPSIGKYIDPTRKKIIYLNKLVMFITTAYIVCWGYILVLTIFNIQDITFLETIYNNIEPFSGLFM